MDSAGLSQGPGTLHFPPAPARAVLLVLARISRAANTWLHRDLHAARPTGPLVELSPGLWGLSGLQSGPGVPGTALPHVPETHQTRTRRAVLSSLPNSGVLCPHAVRVSEAKDFPLPTRGAYHISRSPSLRAHENVQ